MKPTPKVASAGIAGAAVTIVVWLIGLLGVEIPGEVAAALAAVFAFVAGYLIPDPSTGKHTAEVEE